MQLAPSESQARLSEPVRFILQQKGTNVWSISPDASVYECATLMAEKQVGSLVVLSGERLVGLVSERDFVRKVILAGVPAKEAKVRDIMTSPVLYVTPEESIDACLRLMTNRRTRHLPVMRGETVTGLLSIGDLVNWIVTAQEHEIRSLQSYIAGAYPG